MIKTKIKNLVDVRAIVGFVALGSLVTVLPFLIHLQWLTGIIVNAVLIITLFVVGVRAALFLSLIPSLMALSGGLLPPVLSVMVPFIMLSNVIFVLMFDGAYKIKTNIFQAYFLALFVAALTKFIFLLFSINIISRLIIKQELIAKVVQILSWPQFFTAFSGGMLAWLVLRWLRKI